MLPPTSFAAIGLAGAALALTLFLVAAPGPSPAREGAPVVAAAADLQFALTEVAEAFRKETGREVRLAFGSSGNFARQIRQDAPFEVYFSADESYVEQLAREGLVRASEIYAVGRLVLMVPAGSRVR